MRKLFKDLSSGYRHLRHLAGIRVQVRDWGDLTSALAKAPHLLYRWFPEARPRGLVPLGEAVAGSRFSEYLSSEKLPYYPRRRHLESYPAPLGSGIDDEAGLLESFEKFQVNGLVITGGGGFGKTRLMFELGHLAQSRDWPVLRVRGELKPESLERLADRLRPASPALLLIDYIETQPAYGEAIETLDLLVDERSIPLRYIACCRSSFYPAIQLIGRHRRVDLSPQMSDPAAAAWLQDFRESTVRHIVASTGVPLPDRVLAMSRGTPVLAVFAAWLYAHGRSSDLHNLLAEPDFGTWVRKRLQQSFPDPSTADRLGMFMAFFPIQECAVDLLDERQTGLLDTLAQDGWIERVEADLAGAARWEVAHDVLADQVLLACLAVRPATTRLFVRNLFQEAARLGCVLSAFTALQRVSAQSLLGELPWTELITEAMERQPEAWRHARTAALRFPLLDVREQIELLGVKGPAWDGSEEDVEFQNVLGWLAHAVVGGEEIEPAKRVVLLLWVRKAAPRALRSNYLLTQSLRLDPPSVRDPALHWLLSHPGLFQTHYLLRGWLLAKQPPAEVWPIVAKWLARFGQRPHASFVLQSWLDAGGELGLVKEAVSQWLDENGEALEAEFVLQSWLDAGGEPALVKEAVRLWLDQNGTALEAQFVLKSWLDAGGKPALVKEAVRLWLDGEQGTVLEASFVLQSWLDAGGEPALMREAVSLWLDHNGTALEAQFVFKSWLDAGGEKALVTEAVSLWLDLNGAALEAQFVLKSWLDAGGEKELVKEAIGLWLASFSEDPEADFLIRAWLRSKGEFDLVREPAIRWMRLHKDSREASFLAKSLALEAELPTETVHDILAWCRTFSSSEDALWRLAQLGPHYHRVELTSDLLITFEKVAGAMFTNQALHATKRALMWQVFSLFSRWRELRVPTQSLFLAWLRHPASFSAEPSELSLMGQAPELLLYIVGLVSRGALSVEGDRPHLVRFFAWLATWRPDHQDQVRSFLANRAGLSEPVSPVNAAAPP